MFLMYVCATHLCYQSDDILLIRGTSCWLIHGLLHLLILVYVYLPMYLYDMSLTLPPFHASHGKMSRMAFQVDNNE